ncbi:hypothetical protein D3C72_2140270 [compost metagenome]
MPRSLPARAESRLRLPMPLTNSGRQRMPTFGTSSMEAASISVTSCTLSARMPAMVGSPSISTSMTTIRVS